MFSQVSRHEKAWFDHDYNCEVRHVGLKHSEKSHIQRLVGA